MPYDLPIILAGSRPWNRTQIASFSAASLHPVIDVATPSDLIETLKKHPDIRYIFFLHWSFLVPKEITRQHECVCFHMTDVPYGRGGSPLQNLIVRGHRNTMLTALRMEEEIDSGPVYLKRPLSLENGDAEEIYQRTGSLSCEMITEILGTEISPTPQTGPVTPFERRTPDQSKLPDNLSPEQLHDHIRMLDAPGYPHAFIEVNGFRIEFTNSVLHSDSIDASVKISPIKSANS